MFGLADLATAGYLTWGVRKGQRRGLSVELPRLVSVALAFVTGAGLFRWSAHVLGEMNKMGGQVVGAVGWSACLAGSFYAVRWFRARAGERIASRYPTDTLQKRGGMIAGFLRTFCISCMIILILLHTPLAFLVGYSVMGRNVVKIVQPVYHIADRPHD
jgi:hypothetical protein